MAVRVQLEAFDPGVEVNALHAANLGIGAVKSGGLIKQDAGTLTLAGTN